MKKILILKLFISSLLVGFVAAEACAQPPAGGGTLLQFDFNGTNTWPVTLQATNERFPRGVMTGKVGTVDVAASMEASGGMLLVMDRGARTGWVASIQSGPLAVQNAETNLGKLTLSFNLSVTRSLPVKVRVESFNDKQERTGGLETTIYPAAANFYQRYALDLSALKPAGEGAFDPTAPFVGFTIETSSALGWPAVTHHELGLDNVHYATAAYYVSPNGSDANDGRTEHTAFATPQKAVDVAQPGDIILLMGGTYGLPAGQPAKTPVIHFVRPGSPAGWITVKNYPGQEPILSSAGQQAVSITQGKDGVTLAYLEVRGLHIRGNGDTVRAQFPNEIGKSTPNTNTRGVEVNGSGSPGKLIHHIRFADNQIEFCTSDGMYWEYVDWMAVENNVIRNNCWTSQAYVPSGIAVIHSVDFDVTDNSFKSLISGNQVSGNYLTVPNSGKGTKYFNGNGILIDDNGSQGPPNQYKGRTLIQNNVVFNNGGGGVQMWGCHRLDVINNTLYFNGATPELKWGQLNVDMCQDIRIINNIIVAQPDRTLDQWMVSHIDRKTADIFRANNLYWGGALPNVEGINALTGDPLFVNASTNAVIADFRLQSGSPAFKAGRWESFSPIIDLDGKVRPLASSPDIGAFQN